MSSAPLRQTAPVTVPTYSPSEYAKTKGVSLRTVRRWIAAGRLRTIRESSGRLRIVLEGARLPGRHRRYGAADIARWLNKPATDRTWGPRPDPILLAWDKFDVPGSCGLCVPRNEMSAGGLGGDGSADVDLATRWLLAHWNQPPRNGDFIEARDLARLCGERPRLIYAAIERGDLQGFRRRPGTTLAVHWSQAICYADDPRVTATIVQSVVDRYFHDSPNPIKLEISAGVMTKVTSLAAVATPRW